MEQPKSVETSESRQKSEPITDVTRWMLMSEIRTATHGKTEKTLRPDGYRIEFDEGDADATIYEEESDQDLYRLYIDDPGSGVRFLVSEDVDPMRRVDLDEDGGIWLCELIVEGVKKGSGS